MTTYDKTLTDHFKSLGLDENQQANITIIQRTMGSLSIVGSSYVILSVLRNPRKRKHTFHRLMLGLSIADIIFSFFAHVLSTTPMPKGYHIFAIGNVYTCDIVGFMNCLCIVVTPLYMCSLSTYYLIQLKYNWPNRKIQAFEKWLHFVPWSFGLAYAVTALSLRLNGPTGFFCMTTKLFPDGCNLPNSSMECVRGTDAYIYLHLTMFGILGLAICYISITMFRVYKSVSDIEINAHRYSFASYRSGIIHRNRSRRIMLQGVLYSATLVLINLFSIINIFFAQKSLRLMYGLKIAQFTLWPLQGFFNALIYSIPIFQTLHKKMSVLVRKMSIPQTPRKNDSFKSNKTINKGNISNNTGSSSIKYKRQLYLELSSRKQSEEKEESFDGEEVKEEIQKRSSEAVLLHSEIMNNRSEENVVGSSLIGNTRSKNHDDCDINININEGEEMERNEIQPKSHEVLSPRCDIKRSHQFEENIDDIDDYLFLSSS